MDYKKILLAIFLVFFLLICGCVKTYQEMRIKSDLSGSIHVKLVFDLDVLGKSLLLQRFGANMTLDQLGDFEKKLQDVTSLREGAKKILKANVRYQKAKILRQLPTKVKLANFKLEKAEYNQMVLRIELRFSHINDLNKMKNLVFTTPKTKNQFEFFKELKFISTKRSITIYQKIENNRHVAYGVKNSLLPQLRKVFDEFVQNLGIYFRIRCPYVKYRVYKHNCDYYDRKNHTLYWGYTSKKMVKYIKSNKQPKPVYVKLNKRR